MRRPIRSITTLAAPVLTLLALGCAKRAAPGPADAPGDAYARAADYASSADNIDDRDYEQGGPAGPVLAAPEAETTAPAQPQPAATAPEASPRNMEPRATRRSRQDRRKNRKSKKALTATRPPAPTKTGAGAPLPEAVKVAVSAVPTPARDTEGYNDIQENEFIAVADDPRSTFSIDVDTASYSNSRRFLREGQLPPTGAVRIEELINYFDYDYVQPQGSDPFSVTTEVADCPWSPGHQLVHVGLQGKSVAAKDVPPRNLVFLLDVSGSMGASDKLPLLKQGLRMLASQLRRADKVSIVVYAGASGVVLRPTSDKARIIAALDRLQAGGSTNGGAGIEQAYRLAQRSFVKGGINRVLLATDGDFNVGVTNRDDLVRLIEDKRRSGIFLSVLGFGRGNLQDSTMEQLADNGNGNYAYIDSASEAHKVLVEQAGATLMTIAKDVKIQVEFNPAQIAAYRLIGYENRRLAHQDFNNDAKDAGEIGAGHSVTALYEVVPVGQGTPPEVDPLKYQDDNALSTAANNGELMTVKLRYKRPNGSRSKLLSVPVRDRDGSLTNSSANFRFSSAVAEFGLLLRQSKWRGQASWAQAYTLAQGALGSDTHGRRGELLNLIRRAAALSGENVEVTAAQQTRARSRQRAR